MPGDSTSTLGPETVTELVRRAQRGDAAAFADLHRAFARVVHGVVVAHAGAQDAEDVTQDVFMTALERLADLRDAAAFPAWLCTTARNAAVDRRRQLARQRPDALGEVPDPAVPPDEAAAAADAAARVLDCIRGLPVAYRETLVLRLCEGLSGPEIAARTGLTHGSVRVNLTRGMALLRPILQEAGLP
jgi:RNA polymerase sigma-70 factor (ECF subfamily)